MQSTNQAAYAGDQQQERHRAGASRPWEKMRQNRKITKAKMAKTINKEDAAHTGHKRRIILCLLGVHVYCLQELQATVTEDGCGFPVLFSLCARRLGGRVASRRMGALGSVVGRTGSAGGSRLNKLASCSLFDLKTRRASGSTSLYTCVHSILAQLQSAAINVQLFKKQQLSSELLVKPTAFKTYSFATQTMKHTAFETYSFQTLQL